MGSSSREAVVREAYEWLGTPFVDCQAVKGPKGAVDCAMILVCIFKKFELIPADYDPRPYTPEWHLHQNETRYLAGLERFARRTDTPGLGDIAMFRFGRHAAHSGIVVSDTLMIHADKRVGCVSLCERSALASRLDSYWTIFA